MRFTYKLIIALLLLNAAIYPARACLNLYRSLLNGTVIPSGPSDTPQPKFYTDDRQWLQECIIKAKQTYQKSHAINDYSDYGVMLAYSGQYKKAKKIFQKIEAKKPGLYATAANLGTVDELLGQNQQAYKWIKRAIEINPNSHHGSEWIHLKILDAKIHANGNPDYYRTHDILGLDFGKSKIPVNNTNRDLQKTKEQLYDQLSERLVFIKPKDPVVAQLLFDAGNITAITDDLQTALDVYEQAKEFGYSSAVMDKREKYFQQLQKIAEAQTPPLPTPTEIILSFVFLLILIGAIIFGITFGIKKIIKKLKPKN